MNYPLDNERASRALPNEGSVNHGQGGLSLFLSRRLPALTASALWFVFVYFLPLHTLRESRQVARVELTHLLQTERPDTPSILDAFDRATEQVLFSVAGPYFILGVSTLFLVAHLVALKRRLDVAERRIQTLRDVVLGVDEVPQG